jgi:hypothetical protein
MAGTRSPSPHAVRAGVEANGLWPLHVAAASWVIVMLALAVAVPATYRDLVQEDHFIEWWTVGLFAAAAAVRFGRAWPERRVFDLLVALFCLFVAGEEFSWGQRLLGFTPPQAFLEYNTQQEFTIHNFADIFGKPKGVLILALLGYGVVLPVLGQSGLGRRLMARVGATPPRVETAAWFVVAALLLYWYPVEFTGEWVEALAGALFLASAVSARRTFWRGGVAAAGAAVVLTLVSARTGRATPAELACAARETDALLEDLVAGGGARAELVFAGSIHKRVWTAVLDGYLEADQLARFSAVSCVGESEDAGVRRRRVGIDPWGMAYWVRAERPAGGVRRVIVYSMGPNRRRDGRPGQTTGDDIAAVGELPAPE